MKTLLQTLAVVGTIITMSACGGSNDSGSSPQNNNLPTGQNGGRVEVPTPTATPGASPTATPNAYQVRPGVWGGQGALFTVTESGALAAFQCGTGEAQTLFLNQRRQFDVRGNITTRRNGPPRPGDRVNTYPAGYYGSVNAAQTTMTLNVDYNGPRGQVHQRYQLGYQRPAQIGRCAN